MSTLIELTDIHKTYQIGAHTVRALDGVSLSIDAGELLAIMGASGSGKSTLMNIIGLLDHPDQGAYWLEGRNMADISANEQAIIRNRHIGFVFQSFFLLSRLTALQNIALPLRYRGESKKAAQSAASAMLEKVGLPDLAGHRPNEMSGGQQQRVAIARALVGQPSLILADEPTGALDTQTGESILSLFKTLNREEHTTIVIITHDPHIGEQCQRTLRIQDGQLLSNATGH